MEIISFRTPGLGDQTYVLAHGDQAILVDPQRDIDRFLDVLRDRDLGLRFVLETHLHNDYVSGAEQAARLTGAELVLPAAAAPAYDHTPAFHLEDIVGGDLTVRPVHTPGHTPEHTSYVVLVDGEPVALFSGGSLLVGSAGRPDLLGLDRARTLAKLQHRSLHRLAALPRELELFPTHGEGSFCTSSGAGLYTSTVGDEVDNNPLLGLPDADAFADNVLGALMPIPAFYKFMGPANTLGVPPMPDVTVPELKIGDLDAMPDVHVVDIRPRSEQAKGLLPGSTAIELGIDFGSWAGWLVPYNAPIALVAERDQDVEDAVTQLAQLGVDNVQGVIREDLAGSATSRFALVPLPEFLDRLETASKPQLLDVRMPNERAAVRWDGAVERFAADVFTQGVPDELDPSRPVFVACGSGRRAAIVASRLLRDGFEVVALDGAGVTEIMSAESSAA